MEFFDYFYLKIYTQILGGNFYKVTCLFSYLVTYHIIGSSPNTDCIDKIIRNEI